MVPSLTRSSLCVLKNCRIYVQQNSSSAFGFVASFVDLAPLAMSDTESERLALEQDVEDHAARQQTMPMPRQPPMPILPLSQAAVPEPAMAEASVPSARPPLTSRDLS
jgi:hypothetical protein